MNQFQHKLVIMLAVFVGTIVGLFRGTEAKQKWVYKIKSRYEDKRQMAAKKTIRVGEVMLDDIELATGSIMIRQGKGPKPRMVFLGRKTIRAIRAYLRARRDNNPALWVSVHGDRMTYTALRGLLRRRADAAGLRQIPTPHDFRRAFALIMLRNGVDIFALQKLMGHSDLQVLRRYLAQTDEDIHTAHMRGSPVDGNL